MNITIPKDKIADFSRRWQIIEFSLFGSALRDDFKSDSDVDILISFSDEAHWSLYEWVEMIDELKEMFGRKVDLVSKKGIRNPFRRYEILKSREIIYAA